MRWHGAASHHGCTALCTARARRYARAARAGGARARGFRAAARGARARARGTRARHGTRAHANTKYGAANASTAWLRRARRSRRANARRTATARARARARHMRGREMRDGGAVARARSADEDIYSTARADSTVAVARAIWDAVSVARARMARDAHTVTAVSYGRGTVTRARAGLRGDTVSTDGSRACMIHVGRHTRQRNQIKYQTAREHGTQMLTANTARTARGNACRAAHETAQHTRQMRRRARGKRLARSRSRLGSRECGICGRGARLRLGNGTVRQTRADGYVYGYTRYGTRAFARADTDRHTHGTRATRVIPYTLRPYMRRGADTVAADTHGTHTPHTHTCARIRADRHTVVCADTHTAARHARAPIHMTAIPRGALRSTLGDTFRICRAVPDGDTDHARAHTDGLQDTRTLPHYGSCDRTADTDRTRGLRYTCYIHLAFTHTSFSAWTSPRLPFTGQLSLYGTRRQIRLTHARTTARRIPHAHLPHTHAPRARASSYTHTRYATTIHGHASRYTHTHTGHTHTHTFYRLTRDTIPHGASPYADRIRCARRARDGGRVLSRSRRTGHLHTYILRGLRIRYADSTLPRKRSTRGYGNIHARTWTARAHTRYFRARTYTLSLRIHIPLHTRLTRIHIYVYALRGIHTVDNGRSCGRLQHRWYQMGSLRGDGPFTVQDGTADSGLRGISRLRVQDSFGSELYAVAAGSRAARVSRFQLRALTRFYARHGHAGCFTYRTIFF